MNTKRVTTAADVILAALTQNRTAAGIALALESAGMLTPPETAAELTVFRASHDSIVMGRYTTAAEARKHCETVVRREVGDEVFLGWVPDDGSEMAAEELCIGEDVECSGYVVTPLAVATAYDPDADE